MAKPIRKIGITGALLLFFVLFFHSPLSIRSAEQGKLRARSGKLIILDEGPELDQEYDQYYYNKAAKGTVVVYSVMLGYTDSKDTEYFPFFNFSLKKAKKFLIDSVASPNHCRRIQSLSIDL